MFSSLRLAFCYLETCKLRSQIAKVRAVGLETGLGLEANLLLPWSWLFRNGIGLGLKPSWSRFL